MQVPEGFYTIAPGQMNPNSHYYLAFNVGYPNAYDRAYGRTGGNVMVHGVCSSAGCFSMTDEQIDDIYAIARDALPRRAARNPAPVLSVPHDGRRTWRSTGSTRTSSSGRSSRTARTISRSRRPSPRSWSATSTTCSARTLSDPCPRPRLVRRCIATRRSRRRSPRRRPRTTPRSPNSSPRASSRSARSMPTAGRTRSSPATRTQATPTPWRRARRRSCLRIGQGLSRPRSRSRRQTPPGARVPASHIQVAASPAPAPPQAAAQPQPQAVALASTTTGVAGGLWGASTQNVKKWLHLGGQETAPPAPIADGPDQPIPTDVPLPPRRDALLGQNEKPARLALHTPPTPPAKPGDATAKPEAPDPATAPSGASAQ